MSIFQDILKKVGLDEQSRAQHKVEKAQEKAQNEQQEAAEAQAKAQEAEVKAQEVQAEVAATGAASGESAAPATEVDIVEVLTAKAKEHAEQGLDWKRSIVDLLKLLGLDSSLESRRQLATELGYSGDQSDTASMNVWLIKEVLSRVAKNGGKLPAELTH